MQKLGLLWTRNLYMVQIRYLPGLLCQLQGSECFLHGCGERGLVLQHLTQDRTWQLQQHAWNIQSSWGTLVLWCPHIILIVNIVMQEKKKVSKQIAQHACHLTCEFSSIVFVFGVNQIVQLLSNLLQIFLIHFFLKLSHYNACKCHVAPHCHSPMNGCTGDSDLRQLLSSHLLKQHWDNIHEMRPEQCF